LLKIYFPKNVLHFYWKEFDFAIFAITWRNDL